MEEARQMSKKREATRKNLYLQPVEEVLESTKRRIGRNRDIISQVACF
jgi:hypothetical protein